MRLLGGARLIHRRTEIASEGGWALMETIFAAALLIVISLAVFSSMDAASKTSAANKGRTVASQLAEQDQERMRGMTVDQLSGYSDSEDVTVSGVTYHVESSAEWWGDSLGAPLSCATDSKANYIRISSTVTSNVVGKDTKPVTMRGLVAPPVGANSTRGTLAIKVIDRNANPVAGRPVTLSGSASLSATTNALGCAVFAYIPAGAGTTYTATLNEQDWVDQDDNHKSQITPNVTPGDVTIEEMTYDLAGTIEPDFRDSANQPASPTPSTLSLDQTKWFTPLPTRRIAASKVTDAFPFTTSAYNVYAGSCDSAKPSTYGQTVPSALVSPSQTTSPVVRVPTITINIKSTATGNPLIPNGGVTFKATGTGCTEKIGRTTTATGTLAIDLPYGNYSVCADAGSSTKYKVVSVSNNAPGGVSKDILPTQSSTGTGSCPAP